MTDKQIRAFKRKNGLTMRAIEQITGVKESSLYRGGKSISQARRDLIRARLAEYAASIVKK